MSEILLTLFLLEFRNSMEMERRTLKQGRIAMFSDSRGGIELEVLLDKLICISIGITR